MTYRLLVAATLSLGLGTAVALAQTSQTAANLPSDWDPAIADAFFSDTEMGTLRTETEVQTNWADLTTEQQAQVRAHCATVDTAGSALPPAGSDTTAGASTDTTTGMSGGTTGSDTTAGASTDTTTSTDSDITTGSTTIGPIHAAGLEQVCDWIDAM